MAKIALYFDIPDHLVAKLIPSVALHVEITTYGEGQGTTYVTEKSHSAYADGVNARIVVLSEN